MKIGVIGLVPGAGAGFVSSCLAGACAETGICHPAVLELGEGGLYDALALDKHFAGRDYFLFFKALNEDKSIHGRSNMLYDVNWMLRSPEEHGISLSLMKTIRMSNHALGDMILCKVKGVREEDLWKLLWDMDRLLVIIDPLPSKLLAGHKLLCALRTSGLPIIYAVNKMNPGVSRKELQSYLKLRTIHYLPLIDPAIVYSAEYSCRFLYHLTPIKSKMNDPVRNLLQDIFTTPPA